METPQPVPQPVPQPAIRRRPGAALLVGAVDAHVHACPHLNARSVDVFEAVREASEAGMAAIGLMDNFANSAGLAALANRHLGHLGVQVFGGLIMEPPAGGLSVEAVEIALQYGYGAGEGARFVSLPTHHTRHTAQLEGRSPAYIEGCLAIPEKGALPEPLPRILDRLAEADVVFNTGHLSAPEAVRTVETARAAGIGRILVPCSHYDTASVAEITSLGAVAEFSFFFLSHATGIGLTHVDAARHRVPAVSAAEMAALVVAAGPAQAMLNSDCGVFVLPPPVEGLREFLLVLRETGIAEADLVSMTSTVPKRLFRLAVEAPI